MTSERHVVLLSCVKSKLKKPAPAEKLYVSAWFRLALAYARSLRPDLILVLSAKHGVLDLDQVVAPYEETLNRARVAERREWANRTLSQLREVADLDRDDFTILAGERYREFLLPCIRRYRVPMEGLRQGEQLRFLIEQVQVADEPCNDEAATELQTEFVDVCKSENSTTVLVREIHWDGPHSPRTNWTAFRELATTATEEEVAAAIAAALQDQRFFGTCTRCRRRKPAGWMHAESICQSCAERYLGVVY